MTTDNWLAISAGATFLLALAAFWAIWQTRTMQKSEKRERLLNEIIEWGLEVSRCSSVSPFSKYAEIENIQIQRIMIASDLINSFTSLERRGEYIKQIALKLENRLGNAVGEVMINIKERNKLLALSTGIRSVPPLDEMLKIINILEVNGETLDVLGDDAKKLLALGKNAKTLVESVSKVIEKATKIKTRDIG